MLTLLNSSISTLALFQSTQLNLFERFLSQAVSGIDSTSITAGMQNLAYAVLLVGFLWQIYQSAMHGGDVRGLGTNLVKYVVTTIVVMNYHAVFTIINQGFVNAGNWINSASGTENLLQNWGNDLKTQFEQVGFQKLWDLITAGVAGFLDAILIIIAYILYPVVIVIFGFFYILYGSILYIFGPIVIALMPLGATNRLAKSYVENVFIWNAWPVLYGGFGALLSAVQMGQIGQMLNQNDFLGGLGNVEGSILIGLASIIYSLAISVIPFIAKKIVSGDVGATAGSLLGAAVTALTAGIAATEGVAAGVAASSGQTASGGGTSPLGATATGGSAAAGLNQPAAPQRVQPIASAQNSASSRESTAPFFGPMGSASPTGGEVVAGSIRSSLESAVDPKPDARAAGVLHSESSSQRVGETDAPMASALHSPPNPSLSNGTSGRPSARSGGPSPALMRPHGLSSWGAYHAARLATKSAVGVVRGVSNLL